MKKIALVSACLLGVPTRFDGSSKGNKDVMSLSNEYILVPFCPEQLGGLPTPRKPAEIVGDKVITDEGIDVTSYFLRGAEISLEIANQTNPDLVILKENSPSCGVHTVYDGSFSGKKRPGEGLTAKLLKEKYKVFSENELDKIRGN